MPQVAPKKPCQRLLKIKGGADYYLSVSAQTIRDLIHRGELPVVQFGPNAPWLVDVSDLDALIVRYKRTA